LKKNEAAMPDDNARHAEQNHWSECGRGLSLGGSDALGHPHRSVPPLAEMTVRKLIIILTGVAVVLVSFAIGKWWGSANTSEKLMQEEMSRWGKRAALDRSVLHSFPVRRNALTSGTYLMDVWFPSSKLPAREVVLNCANGQITVPAFNRNRGSQTLSVEGNVVSWTQEGGGYEADTEYVGLIDGNEMWGRIYGWNPGDQSLGLWRIYPKPSTNGQP
jgi:hypothetical protein